MNQIFLKKFNRKVTEKFSFSFNVKEEGLYIVKIIARARSEKQIGLNVLDDDDLKIEIDDRKFPMLNNLERYFDSPAAFSGGRLHNLKKMIFFFIYFSRGKHTLNFIPDREPTLEELFVLFAGDKVSDIELEVDDQAEDGDRRPWITFVLVNLSFKQLQTKLKTQKRFIDSDDVKLIIDGEIKRNLRDNFRRFWFWVGSFFAGEVQNENFDLGLEEGLHYIEFEADRMPTLYKVAFDFGEATKRIPNQYDPKWIGDPEFKTDSEEMILARAIFGEARGTSRKTKIAVAWTIKNRVLDHRWGNTYHEVILQPVQYSAFNRDDHNYIRLIDPFCENNLADKESWQECYEIAGKIKDGELVDPTNGANHYYDESIDAPDWATEKNFKMKIETIFFYRL